MVGVVVKGARFGRGDGGSFVCSSFRPIVCYSYINKNVGSLNSPVLKYDSARTS